MQLGFFVSEEFATTERWASAFGIGPVSMSYEAKKAHYEGGGHRVVGGEAAFGHRGTYADSANDFGFVIEVVAPKPTSCIRSPTFRVSRRAGVTRTLCGWPPVKGTGSRPIPTCRYESPDGP